MKLFTTFAAASLLATGSALAAENIYNGTDTIEFALLGGDPAEGQGEEIKVKSRGIGNNRLSARDLDPNYCYLTIYKNNDCSGVGTIQYKFDITKGNHECINTQDHHSIWWSSGCAKEHKGHIFLYSGKKCRVWSDYVQIWKPDEDKTGCIGVNLDGHNWQSAFWQWGYTYD